MCSEHREPKTAVKCNSTELLASLVPDWDVQVPELCDLDVDFDEESPHETPNGPHTHKDGQVPHIVEHARAIESEAVCVEAKVSVAAKVGDQHLAWVLLHKEIKR